MPMPTEVMIALIGLGGSAIGSLIGMVANSKLIDFRLAAIERKLDEHNKLIDRMYAVENRLDVLDVKVSDLERSKN